MRGGEGADASQEHSTEGPAESEALMAQQGIRNPPRYAAMMLPGLEE